MNTRRSIISKGLKRQLTTVEDCSHVQTNRENIVVVEQSMPPITTEKRPRLVQVLSKPLSEDTDNRFDANTNSVFAGRFYTCTSSSDALYDPAHLSLNQIPQENTLSQSVFDMNTQGNYRGIDVNSCNVYRDERSASSSPVLGGDEEDSLDLLSDDSFSEVDVEGIIRGCVSEGSYESIVASTAPLEMKVFQVVDVMANHFKDFDEDIIIDDVSKIQTKLMYNQKKNLHFMVHREKCQPFSGILADDMGLGKTLSVISLILYQKENGNVQFDEDAFMEKNASVVPRQFFNYTKSRATIIVVPAIILKQWQDEIKKHVKRGSIRYKVYDPKHTKECVEIEDLLDVDIVLTTYDVVKIEYRKIVRYNLLAVKSHILDDFQKQYLEDLGNEIMLEEPVLPNIFFERVVLDEVHAIKKANTYLARACCFLNGIKRWGITGTPIQNSLDDFYSIIKFLKIAPFDLKNHFNYLTSGRSDKKVDYFNKFIKCILVRSEKDFINPETGKAILDVPKRNFSDITVSFGGIERRVYERMYFGFRPQVADVVDDFLEKKDMFGRAKRYKKDSDILNPFLVKGQHIDVDGDIKMSLVLSLTTRLRQACCHMNLVAGCVDMERLSGVEDGEEVTEYDDEAICLIGSTQALEEEKDRKNASACSLEQVFSKTYQSPKVRSVLEKVRDAILRNDKCIIVSQWTSMLDIFAKIFDDQGVDYSMITGRDSISVRNERIATLNDDPSGPKIYLLSLLASGTGVNLIGANHMFLVDLFWNPAVEKQCFDRIFRFGQTKETFIYRFICNDSIEQRILEIQEKKNKLSLEVLHHKMKRDRNGYNIHDVRKLWKV